MMRVEDVDTKLQQCLGIDIRELVEADPGSAHNLLEEWNATVEKVHKLVNHVGVRQGARTDGH